MAFLLVFSLNFFTQEIITTAKVKDNKDIKVFCGWK